MRPLNPGIPRIVAGSLLLISLSSSSANARPVPFSYPAPAPVQTASPPPPPLAPVDFLAAPPVIDGILDPALSSRLPRRGFSKVDRFINADAQPPDAHYRLAYGTDFLYVYVEAQGDALAYNDRAYQNGDGFHLVIAKPLPGDAPTTEFYVAACSAVNRPDLEWTRRVFWYYNVDKIFVSMSRQARSESAAHDGVISLELLIPWQDLHPFHPWLSEGIGFNLGFVKANPKGGRVYYRVLDASLGAENQPRRYVRLPFAEPSVDEGLQTFVQLDRNHLRRDEALTARAVSLSAAADNESLRFYLLSGEGDGLTLTSVEYPCPPGLTRREFSVSLDDPLPGGYRTTWRSNRCVLSGDDSTRASALTIFPAADSSALEKRLTAVRTSLSPGSFTTLRFLISETFDSLRKKPAYETAAEERLALERLEADLSAAEAGQDAWAARTGFLRRAFRSAVDGTLQPYCVRIPVSYDPGAAKKYPLVVFLHGSASDETNLAGFDFLTEGDCIALGPRGRGPSNAFARDHAQEDIEEAIAAVIESYPIDTQRIILTGFSMGGYGVYRTFHEHPERYRALAVFSGHPGLAAAYFPGESHPNFLNEDILKKFAGMPMFIFHGRQDRNCPIAVTEQLVKKLEAIGAKVNLVIEDGAGHQRPGPETLKLYREWLRKVIGG
jgi:predicted esterase